MTDCCEHVFKGGLCEHCSQSKRSRGGQGECPVLLRQELDEKAGVVWIPTIGTQLVLARDWSFTLHEEGRNYKFSKNFPHLRFIEWAGNRPDGPKVGEVTLPRNTILTVDRIYLRQGAGAFDSVSFRCNTGLRLTKAQKEDLIRGRFWAKLEDVNEIRFKE
jgi:hypothetical protein